jgi:hypothetical protein
MTLTKSVVIVWTIPKTDIQGSCQGDLDIKLDAMAGAGQTDKSVYWHSPRVVEYRFTDQDAAEEFAGYVTLIFPCNTDIESVAINSI